MTEGRRVESWARYLTARKLVPVCPWCYKGWEPPALPEGSEWVSRICPDCAARLARDLAVIAVESLSTSTVT